MKKKKIKIKTKTKVKLQIFYLFVIYGIINRICFTVLLLLNLSLIAYFSLLLLFLFYFYCFIHSKPTGFAVGYIQTTRSIRWTRQWGAFLLRSICWFDTFARFKELHFMVSSVWRWHGAKYWNTGIDTTVGIFSFSL